MENGLESMERNNPEVVFGCRIEEEINRVKYICSKYEWYKENGYHPTYPKALEDRLESGQPLTEEDIKNAVTEEFDQEANETHLATLKESWEEIELNFFESLKTLGLPLQAIYSVSLTKYGNGGSYGMPNRVQYNPDQNNQGALTIGHEIVHLTIEHLIRQYQIDHWTKERVVDLIIGKFFPDKKRLQRNPSIAEEISDIFEREFPDIEKTISEIANLK